MSSIDDMSDVAELEQIGRRAQDRLDAIDRGAPASPDSRRNAQEILEAARGRRDLIEAERLASEAYWAGLTVEHLVDLCQDGNPRACEELDRRGLEQPMLDLDDTPVSRADTRSDVIAAIGVRAVGKTLVGLEVDRGGTFKLRLAGGDAIVIDDQGDLGYEEVPLTDLAAVRVWAQNGGCPVCGDPTGVRCCEYGRDR